MKKLSVFLLLVLMLTMLALPALAAEAADNATTPSVTPPPMPTISLSTESDAGTGSSLPDNAGSIIGVCLAGVMVVAVVVVVIVKKRK